MDIKKFGRYEIEGVLGQGAMGIVYKGVDPKIGRVVALKTLKPGADLSPDQLTEFKNRFSREAQSAGRLTHPNIVTIYDVGEDEGVSFIAMEFVKGKPLDDLILQKQPFSVDDIIKIMTDICSGLGYAHKNGIIHRDIKPANIILTDDGAAKIMDFGIAKIVSTTATQTGMIVGTPSYMSPEQITGRAVDARTDIFSLGAVFYELLTHEKAFPGDNITTVMYRVVNENPAPVSVVNLGVPTQFSPIIQKAMSKNPNDRYPDTESFARDIQSYQTVNGQSMAGATVVNNMDYQQTMVMSSDNLPAGITSANGTNVIPQKKRSKAPLILTLAAVSAAAILALWFFTKDKPALPGMTAEGTANFELTLNIPDGTVTFDTSKYSVKNGFLQIPKISAAEHELTIQREGYQDFKTKLLFSENEEKKFNVELKLAPFRFPEGVDTAYLSVESQPNMTRVETSTGQFIGYTPIIRHPFPSGKHSLVFSKEFYISLVKDVEIKKAQDVKLSPILDYKKGYVSTSGFIPNSTQLFFDGVEYRPLKKQPFLYQLPLGEHKIILKKDGYKSLEQNVTVNDKDTFRLSGRLEQLFGSLFVTSDPAGAEVFINGKASGKTPLKLESVTAGVAEIRVLKSGMSSKKKMTITENKENTVSFKLEATSGTVKFIINPWANVFIDDKNIGASPPLEDHELKSGTYKIRIENPAFKPILKTITVKAGETLTVKHDFK